MNQKKAIQTQNFQKMNQKTINEKFRNDVERFVDICKKLFRDNLKSIVLFGSAARNEYGRWSDLDFCVVVRKRHSEKEEFDLKLKIRELFGKHTDIVFREEMEIPHLLQINSSVDLDIFEEGLTVYGKDILSERHDLFKEIVKKNHLVHKPELGKGVWEYGY